jgi:hypothetical protein
MRGRCIWHVFRGGLSFSHSVLSDFDWLEPCSKRLAGIVRAKMESQLRDGFVANCELRDTTGLAFILAWLHSGGNPHGMGTAPGVWQILVRVFWWTLAASVALAVLGKGKGRFLVLAAAASAVFADFAVIILDMD